MPKNVSNSFQVERFAKREKIQRMRSSPIRSAISSLSLIISLSYLFQNLFHKNIQNIQIIHWI